MSWIPPGWRPCSDSSVIDDLLALGARVALTCSDFSDERASQVRRLNAAGVPVVGLPLLPLAEGYYFTADNADLAADCYREWAAWTHRHELVWEGVGLDIEPDARIYLQIMNGPWGLVPMLLPRLFDRARPARSQTAYRGLVERIHADGWRVENCQFPLIADERQAGGPAAAAGTGGRGNRPRGVDALLLVHARAGAGADLGLWASGTGYRGGHHRRRPGYPGFASEGI